MLAFRRSVIRAKLSVPDAINTLSKEVDSSPSLWLTLSGQSTSSEKSFFGTVSTQEFVISPVTNIGPFFLPVVRGLFENEDDETVFYLSFGVRPILWAAVILFLIIAEYPAWGRGGFSWVPLAVVSAVLIANFVFFFLPECRRVEKRLSVLLSAEE
jgi:hypothetical protein